MPDKKPKLTVKEQKLIKGIAAGKSNTQAAKDAGYSEKTAYSIAHETLKKPDVQQALHQALVKHGITLDTAIAPIGKALTATKVEIHKGTTTAENGDVIEQAFAEEVEDIDLQLKGSDRALKLMGISNPEGGTVNVNFINVARDLKDEYGI